jgi:hypothetical protein
MRVELFSEDKIPAEIDVNRHEGGGTMFDYETYFDLLVMAECLYDSVQDLLDHVTPHELPRGLVEQAEESIDAYLRWCERRIEEVSAIRLLPD